MADQFPRIRKVVFPVAGMGMLLGIADRSRAEDTAKKKRPPEPEAPEMRRRRMHVVR